MFGLKPVNYGILVELANNGSSTVAVIGLNVALMPEERAGVDQLIIDFRSRGVILDQTASHAVCAENRCYLEHFEQNVLWLDRHLMVHLLHQRTSWFAQRVPVTTPNVVEWSVLVIAASCALRLRRVLRTFGWRSQFAACRKQRMADASLRGLRSFYKFAPFLPP